jgi:plastocyanin
VTTSNGPLHSPTMQAGATFRYTFAAVGTFNYLCTIHPFMTAVVTVTP